MKDDGSRLEIYGKVVTGWKAKLIVLAIIAALIASGFNAGYRVGVHHACSAEAV